MTFEITGFNFRAVKLQIPIFGGLDGSWEQQAGGAQL